MAPAVAAAAHAIAVPVVAAVRAERVTRADKGAHAARALLDLLAGRQPVVRHELSAELVVRGSTSRPAGTDVGRAATRR